MVTVKFIYMGFCVNFVASGIDVIKKFVQGAGIFTPRGGISIWPYANYGRKGTKYEKIAVERFLRHE